MKVRIAAFASAAEALGYYEREREVERGATVGDVVTQLGRECPRIAAAAERLKFAVNLKYATADVVLQEGDELAVIPPVSGGANPAARIVREAIDIAALIREVEDAAAGAITTFTGVVRYETGEGGRALRALEYTAHETMAVAEMARICEAASQRHAVHRLVAAHRLGLMRIGEISIAVVASAAHRGDAFDAVRWTVDEIKKSAPIFKREIWHDGSTTWVEGV